MQKVEGSNPFIRSMKAPLRRGFPLWSAQLANQLCPRFVPNICADGLCWSLWRPSSAHPCLSAMARDRAARRRRRLPADERDLIVDLLQAFQAGHVVRFPPPALRSTKAEPVTFRAR